VTSNERKIHMSESSADVDLALREAIRRRDDALADLRIARTQGRLDEAGDHYRSTVKALNEAGNRYTELVGPSSRGADLDEELGYDRHAGEPPAEWLAGEQSAAEEWAR
jgi:flavin-binding protein dodecin